MEWGTVCLQDEYRVFFTCVECRHRASVRDLVEVGIDFRNSWELLWMNKRLPRTKGLEKLRTQYNYCDSRRHILIT